MELQQFIKKVHPGLSEEAAEKIASLYKQVQLPKNTITAENGKTCTDAYFIKKGIVLSSTMNVEGEEVCTGIFTSGEMVFEPFSFFRRVPCRETFVTVTECSFMHISYEDLQKAFHALPEFREYGRAVLISAYAVLKQRMLAGLHMTAEERYAQLMKNDAEIIQQVPLKSIASYLGVTDSSLSRIRKEFVRK